MPDFSSLYRSMGLTPFSVTAEKVFTARSMFCSSLLREKSPAVVEAA